MDGIKWYHIPLLAIALAIAKVRDVFRGRRP
jgi:hypothetical protein